MTFQCNFCKKKPYERQNALSHHIQRKHWGLIQDLVNKRKEEEKRLMIFAYKIQNIPEKFNIPSEYTSDFLHFLRED